MATVKTVSKTVRLFPKCVKYSTSAQKFESPWTPENIVVSPHTKIEIPNETITEHLWKNVERWADKTALICGVTSHSYTYHQLLKFSLNFGSNLRKKLKVQDGDVICIMMHNCPEYAVAILGILEAGAQVTTVNPIYTAHEVQKQLTLSLPKILIVSTETLPIVREALKLAKKDIPIITVTKGSTPQDTISFKEFAEDDNADHSVLKEVKKNSADIAILPYSSGTTGLPKGVELTHRNIVVNCMQMDVEGVKQYEDTTEMHQDSSLAVLPYYHCYGMVIVMLHKLSVGCNVVSLPRFKPDTFLTAMKEQKISLLYAAPPIMLYLASNPEVKRENIDTVTKIMCGAAPLPHQDIVKILEKTKANKTQVIQLYGLTETSPLATAMIPGTTNFTTAGVPVSNTELKTVDANGKTLGPDEVGELWIRGPQIMKGYRNNPEATQACITEDGWFKSGDLAKLDKEGNVTIADRLKELIKVKGFQVPPAELENVLKEHPAVIDAGVVGMPDSKTGEAPKAFVVLKEGASAKPGDIVDFVKERVAEFKRIKDVVILESLPKNPSGKLLRRVLKEKYC